MRSALGGFFQSKQQQQESGQSKKQSDQPAVLTAAPFFGAMPAPSTPSEEGATGGGCATTGGADKTDATEEEGTPSSSSGDGGGALVRVFGAENADAAGATNGGGTGASGVDERVAALLSEVFSSALDAALCSGPSSGSDARTALCAALVTATSATGSGSGSGSVGGAGGDGRQQQQQQLVEAAISAVLGADPSVSEALAARLLCSDGGAGSSGGGAPEQLSRELGLYLKGDLLKAYDALEGRRKERPESFGPGAAALVAACGVRSMGEASPGVKDGSPRTIAAALAPAPAALGTDSAAGVAAYAEACLLGLGAGAPSSGGKSGGAAAALAAQSWAQVACSYALLGLSAAGGGVGSSDVEKISLRVLQEHLPGVLASFRARSAAGGDGGGSGDSSDSSGGAVALLLEEAEQDAVWGSTAPAAPDAFVARWESVKKRDGEAAESVTAVGELLGLIGLATVKREFINLYERVQIAKEQRKPPAATLNARFEG